jgi:hypothetical protein
MEKAPQNLETSTEIQLPDGFSGRFLVRNDAIPAYLDIGVSKYKDTRMYVVTITFVNIDTGDQKMIFASGIQSIHKVSDPTDKRGSEHMLFTNKSRGINSRFEIRLYPSTEYVVKGGDVSHFT